jgi:hypothetical protein
MRLTVVGVFFSLLSIAVVAVVGGVIALDYGLISINFQERPSNVPLDAAEIPNIGKTWMYARCWSASDQNHCEVFNPDGTLAWNEVVVPDKPTASVAAEQLQIDVRRSHPRDFIGLKNGMFLLPSSDYASHKLALEEFKQVLKRAEEYNKRNR